MRVRKCRDRRWSSEIAEQIYENSDEIPKRTGIGNDECTLDKGGSCACFVVVCPLCIRQGSGWVVIAREDGSSLNLWGVVGN